MIDQATQDGRIPVVRGQHAAAMLMLVRDYIQPLPRGLDADAVTDSLTTDLCAMVMALREARQATGHKGQPGSQWPIAPLAPNQRLCALNAACQ